MKIFIRIIFLFLVMNMLSQSNSPALLKKLGVCGIIRNYTSTNLNMIPYESHDFIDSMGVEVRSTQYNKNDLKDSSLTVYKYDSLHNYKGETTTSNTGFSNEVTYLGSNMFSDKTVFKDQMLDKIIRIQHEGRKTLTYINDTLESIRYTRNKKYRKVCKVIRYTKSGRQINVSHEKYFYNKAQQNYKCVIHVRANVFKKSYFKKRHYTLVMRSYFDNDGLLKRVTNYSSNSKTSSVTVYRYLKRN